jgi:hypothetical protein
MVADVYPRPHFELGCLAFSPSWDLLIAKSDLTPEEPGRSNRVSKSQKRAELGFDFASTHQFFRPSREPVRPERGPVSSRSDLVLVRLRETAFRAKAGCVWRVTIR